MNPMLYVLLFVLFDSIIARGPPVLLPHTPNLITLEVNENEPVELRCPVAITPDLAIQWSKDNEDLDPVWRTPNLSIKRFLLKLNRAQTSDAGLYKCNAVNGFGNVQAQFQVVVTSNGTSLNDINSKVDEPDIMIWDMNSLNGEAPKFLLHDEQSQIQSPKVIQPEGTNVQFRCLATGKPSPQIRWKKNGKILSEDEYGATQSQILNIKDLRQSDTGNYTCEVFNSFGSINATYQLFITEKLQFFGNHPQNTSARLGEKAVLQCAVRTKDPKTKIQWLKKIDNQQLFSSESTIYGSEQYATIEQSSQQQYFNNILSKSLIFSKISIEDSGEYTCLIQNERANNYKTAFINVIDTNKVKPASSNNSHIVLYAIVILLAFLGSILFLIFCCAHCRRQNGNQHSHSHCTDSLRSSIKPRQPLIHHNGVMYPTTASRTSNDYLVESMDSIPVPRQNPYQQPQQQADLGSLKSTNLYYARIPAL